MTANCTFHSFKPSGKWYATGRGVLTETVFKVFDRGARRKQILADNDGRYPGLSGSGEEFVLIVLADDDVDFGFPLMLLRED